MLTNAQLLRGLAVISVRNQDVVSKAIRKRAKTALRCCFKRNVPQGAVLKRDVRLFSEQGDDTVRSIRVHKIVIREELRPLG